MNQRNLLRVLSLGFALVVLLVLAAAYTGYQGSRSIQDNAQQLVRDHLVTQGKASELEARIEEQSKELVSQLGLMLGACLLLAAGTAGLTLWFANRTVRRLEWQTQELNRVSWHMLEDQEHVARRFSHEMHDELGQALTALKGMVKRVRPEDLEAYRIETVEVLDEVLHGVRELSQLLRPVILDDFGLDAALRWLVERFSQRTQILVVYDSDFHERPSEQVETHFFRIAQEALTNIARHSSASQAWVRLDESNGRIGLTIEDNGTGMRDNRNGSKPSLGMVGMRARARHLNGELDVSNGPKGGLRVAVSAPLGSVAGSGI